MSVGGIAGAHRLGVSARKGLVEAIDHGRVAAWSPDTR